MYYREVRTIRKLNKKVSGKREVFSLWRNLVDFIGNAENSDRTIARVFSYVKS